MSSSRRSGRKNDRHKTEEEEIVIIEGEAAEKDPVRFDVKHGVAHGYWKDLLNLLALHVNDKLELLTDPRDILHIEQEKGRSKWPNSQEEAKSIRRGKRDARHETAVKLFSENPVHPLSEFEGFNDRYAPANIEGRTFYLRHARDAYRKDVAVLREHLECVERDITAKTHDNTKYDRVPSLAMNNYAPLFASKDSDRFEEYIDQVATGEARISGATLLPSTLINAVRGCSQRTSLNAIPRKRKGTEEMVQGKIQDMHVAAKTLDLQWKTLVQRVKDSGTLDNYSAVADVSGSMDFPVFQDSSTPMDSSICLSLLIAEATKGPFSSAFITFSTDPVVEQIDPCTSLREKYDHLSRTSWSMSTDFVAVFEKLILPMVLNNKVKQEDMVKRVSVFPTCSSTKLVRATTPDGLHLTNGSR